MSERVWEWTAAGSIAAAAGLLVPFIARSNDAGGSLVLAAVGVVSGIAALILAFRNFEMLLLACVAGRISLDAVRLGPLTAGTILAGFFTVVALAHLIKWRRQHPLMVSPAAKALVVLSFVALLSAGTSTYPLVAAVGAMQVAAGAVMFLVLEQMLPGNPRAARRLLMSVGVSLVVPLLVGAQQFFTSSGYVDTSGFSRINATAVHPTPLATYLVILLGALAAYSLMGGAVRRWAAVGGVLSGALLIGTYTRSAWIAASLAVMCVAVRYRQRIVVPILAVGTVVVSAIPQISERMTGIGAVFEGGGSATSDSLAWRFHYWDSILHHARENPVLGLGLGVVEIREHQGVAPHNVFLQAYVELGILGAVALGLLLVGFVRTIARRKRESVTDFERAMAVACGASGIGLLVQAAASNVLTQTMFYWYFAAATAWGYVSAKVPQEVDSSANSLLNSRDVGAHPSRPEHEGWPGHLVGWSPTGAKRRVTSIEDTQPPSPSRRGAGYVRRWRLL